MNQKKISLDGLWRVELEEMIHSVAENWSLTQSKHDIYLPGTLDEEAYGKKVTEVDLFRLNRKNKFIGIARYNRTINLPVDIKDKHVTLFLERCMWRTEVWINGIYVGSEDSLCTPHRYSLDGYLIPGDNLICIKVDNSPQYDLGEMSHGYSEEVQTIWNGIVGKIELLIQELFYIEKIEIYPKVDLECVQINIDLCNITKDVLKGMVEITVLDNCEGVIGKWSHEVKVNTQGRYSFSDTLVFDEVHTLNEYIRLWDEFEPNIYVANVDLIYLIDDSQRRDSQKVTFGMREFSTQGPVFVMNGKTIFLRGTHDAGNFPLTGYPSMNIEDWLRIYTIGKSYGINHFRFHSWCPPEAAFAAADQCGIILQTELPLFGYTAAPIGEDTLRDAFLERELLNILKSYGNHPSFV
jgi:beta-galactosidase/beta-glucuronidase